MDIKEEITKARTFKAKGAKFEVHGADISDGYHTFTELYDHRVALYLALCKLSGLPCFYKLDYEEWFCVYLETSEGQISYHVPNKFLDSVKGFASYSKDHVWDKHTGGDVISRLTKLLKTQPGEDV